MTDRAKPRSPLAATSGAHRHIPGSHNVGEPPHHFREHRRHGVRERQLDVADEVAASGVRDGLLDRCQYVTGQAVAAEASLSPSAPALAVVILTGFAVRVTGHLADEQPDHDRQASQDSHNRGQQRGHENADDPSQHQGHDKPPESKAAPLGPSSKRVQDRRQPEPQAPAQPPGGTGGLLAEPAQEHYQGIAQPFKPPTRPLARASVARDQLALRSFRQTSAVRCALAPGSLCLLPTDSPTHDAGRKATASHPEPAKPGPPNCRTPGNGRAARRGTQYTGPPRPTVTGPTLPD